MADQIEATVAGADEQPAGQLPVRLRRGACGQRRTAVQQAGEHFACGVAGLVFVMQQGHGQAEHPAVVGTKQALYSLVVHHSFGKRFIHITDKRPFSQPQTSFFYRRNDKPQKSLADFWGSIPCAAGSSPTSGRVMCAAASSSPTRWLPCLSCARCRDR